MAVVIVGVLAVAPSALAGGAVRLAPVPQLAHPFGHAVHAGRTFQMVGVRWKGTGAVRLQARSTSGSWTRWVALSQEAPVWTGPARRVRMRRSGDVRDLAVTFITIPRVASPARGTVIPAVAGRPAIVTRAGWHADESIRRAQPSYAPALKMVFVHHTDTATSA
ncbi:MAG: hypothetical protein ACRDQE_08870, partial [Gaiellales bacterium]